MNSSVIGLTLEALRKHREELGDRQEPLVMPAERLTARPAHSRSCPRS